MLRLLVLVPLAALLLEGCGAVSNTFVVNDPEGQARAAEVELCGTSTILPASYRGFRGAVPISCEGGGKVLVRFENGRETTCVVGYVTPGAEQQFDYLISDGKCQPKISKQ